MTEMIEASSMSLIAILFLALALSLDAFSVSISCGVKLRTFQIKNLLKIAFAFGFFQFLMPVLGGAFGGLLADYVRSFAHILVFLVFAILGGKCWWSFFTADRLGKKPAQCFCTYHNWRCLLSLSLATSIDAFLAGMAIRVEGYSVYWPAFLIGVFTFFMALAGGLFGNRIAFHFEKWANLIAGSILILLALKALLRF